MCNEYGSQTTALLAEMSTIGLVVDHLIVDGSIKRVSVAGKTKKNGWYCATKINNKLFATFGRWDTCEKCKFSNNEINEERLTEEEIEQYELLKTLERQRKQKNRENAKEKAQALFEQGSYCFEHEYLTKKKISALGLNIRLRKETGELLIPVFSPENELVNLQRITIDGEKKFLFGGEISFCAFTMQTGEQANFKIFLCEGFATGCSILEVLKHERYKQNAKVLVCFSADNLFKVSTKIKAVFPNNEIFICADNDKNGIGLDYAEKAKKECCGKILIPERVGYDFNDLFIKEGLDAVSTQLGLDPAIEKDQILEQKHQFIENEDLTEDENLSLIIPDKVIEPALIQLGLNCAEKAGLPNIPQFILPTIFSLIARCLAGKISCCNVHPSFYNIKVGGTSTGKTDCDNLFELAILQRNLENFYGFNDFASGVGLLRGLASEPQTLVKLDEITYLFKNQGKHDTIRDGKISALLEVFSCAGKQIKKVYADKTNTLLIERPCLILTGNATPVIFENIQAEDFESGLMQRFDFWCYDGKIPYRTTTSDAVKALSPFVDKIQELFNFNGNKEGVWSDIGGSVDLVGTEAFNKRLKEYSKQIIDFQNGLNSDSERGITSRSYHLAIKYAILHHAITKPLNQIFEAKVDSNSLEYGILVAKMLINWKRKKLFNQIVYSEFHKKTKLFKTAILACIKVKRKATLKAIINRRKALKALKKRELEEIIEVLKTQGDLEEVIEKNKRIYKLLKN